MAEGRVRPARLVSVCQVAGKDRLLRLALVLWVSASAAFYACAATKMTLSWQDTSENEDGFRIYRVTGERKVLIAEVGPNVTRYVDTESPPDACYIVTAYNAAGESPPTVAVCR